MWKQYRKWKPVLVSPLVILALFFMSGKPELSPLWFAGMGVAVLLGAAYVAEEIVWMAKRHGRPCGHCGRMVPMKSFSVCVTCPHCGIPFE